MAKTRDWKREAQLRKANTKQFAFRVEKSMGEDLINCLKEKRIPLAKWFKNAVENTLDEWDDEYREAIRLAVPEYPEEGPQPDVSGNEKPDESKRLAVMHYDVDEALKLRIELGLSASSKRTFERAVKKGKLVSTSKRGRKNLYSYDCVVAWDGKG